MTIGPSEFPTLMPEPGSPNFDERMEHFRGIEDALRWTRQIVQKLEPFTLRTLTLANGEIVHVLAIPVGFDAAGSGALDSPWAIKSVGSQDAGWEVTMNPGTVAGMLPSNIHDPISGDGSNSLRYVKAVGQASNSGLTSLEIEINGTPPKSRKITEGGIPSSIEILVALIDEREPLQVEVDNLEINPVQALETDKDSLSPGEYPLKKWWKWEVVRQ